ncbi:MAG: PAS domain-containing sensor histidine kinase [Holosporaceae bacterium]|jgi:signal transduction histidine kinase/CheY-like chemotaxis protein|nr:PAS domain-containing sensor histidine kinase [Holosporaceae bacterium]
MSNTERRSSFGESGSKQEHIESVIAMFRNFSPEVPVKNAVVYFWESHNRNPDDKKRTQATVDLIHKEFDLSTCEKYEIRTGYLSRYDYLPRQLKECTEEEVKQAIIRGEKEQDDWIERCSPDLSGFLKVDWWKCISPQDNPHYENCRNLVLDKIKSDADFAAAFAKSVSEFAETHDIDESNGHLYIVEETSWILTLPLQNLNKPVYLLHIGSATSAVVAMFHYFPNLQKAVRWLAPRFTHGIYANVSEFLLDYRNATHAGHSYAMEDRDAVREITLFKKDEDDAQAGMRKQLEEEQAKNELLQSIIGKIPGHVYWLDCNHIYQGCNNLQAEQLRLTASSDIIGKRNCDLHDTEEANKLDDINKKVMETGQENEIEESICVRGKKRNYLSKKAPLVDRRGKVIGLLGLSIDITDRKKAEELKMLSKLQEEKLEGQLELQKFVASVAHDITSPLVSLKCFAKTCINVPEDQRTFLISIVTSIQNITSDLLNRHMKEQKSLCAERMQHLLVHLALQEVIDQKKHRYNDMEMKFHYSYGDDTKFTFVKIDVSNFSRMISNLINNAVEAYDGKPGEIQIFLDQQDQRVRIVIKDKGKGMPQVIVDKINRGEKIETTKQFGHGIGLAQITSTVKLYKGKIFVESTEGMGTTFNISFPATGRPEWMVERVLLPKGSIVVVVDDEEVIYHTWRTLLKELDVELKFFSNAKEAVDFLEGVKRNDTFLLADQELKSSEISGLLLIQQSKMKNRAIIVTNSYDDKDLQEAAEQSGVKILPKQLMLDIPVEEAEMEMVQCAVGGE